MHKPHRSTTDGSDIPAMWRQKSTVGWTQAHPVTIRFDLGKNTILGSVAISVAAGASSVYWPRVIALMVSEDNKSWRYAGDVIALAGKTGMPPAQGYAIHRFVTPELNIAARHLALIAVPSGTSFFFTDEVTLSPGTKVRVGPFSATGESGFPSLETARRFVLDNLTRFGVSARLLRDYHALKAELNVSGLPMTQKQLLQGRLDAALAKSENDTIPPDAEFRTILPLSPSHREMLAVHGAVLAARGLSAHFVRKNHRYQYVEWLDVPANVNRPGTASGGSEVNMNLLDGQRGTDAFWVGNASESPQKIRIRINTPRGVRRDWIRVMQVPWTDTAQNIPVAAAFLPMRAEDYVYTIDLAAGMTSKIWIEIDGSKIPVGNYNTSIVVAGNGPTVRMPFGIRVLSTKMSRPRIGLSLWDYTDRDGMYGVTAYNLAASIPLMQHYGVDAPWARPSAVPMPDASHFDSNNRLVKPLDFSIFDTWVARWPGARRYCLFGNWQEPVFAGTKMGTPEFDARVGSWGRAMAQHMGDLKLRPEQLVFLPFDEPGENEHDAVVAGWLRALQKGAPELTYLNDPVWRNPNLSQHQDAFDMADILCPNVQIFLASKEISEKYYRQKAAKGKELWFYECSAVARLADPTAYFRMPALLTFRMSGTAVNYWSYGDTGGPVNSWNEYTAQARPNFSPAFLGNDAAHGSIHLAAIYDGLQDYEILSLLREAVKRSRNSQNRQAALKLLSTEALSAVSDVPDDYRWISSSGHERIDDYREQVVDLLDKIARK